MPLYLQQRSNFFLSYLFKIRPLLASAMLLLFAFSITPRVALHNAFSHHQHRQIFADGAHKVVSTAGPNCSFDNVFAAAFFAVPGITEDFTLLILLPDHSSFIPGKYHHRSERGIRLRGPPSLA